MADAEAPCSWAELPSGSASEGDWAAFKSDAFEELIDRIQQTDRVLAGDPHARLERIRQLRREHHLIVIADRIRRSSASPHDYSGAELRRAAEFVLDRSTYLVGKRAEWGKPRSRLEERVLGSARVSWHKLMRRAGSPAELRGRVAAPRRELLGITKAFRKITAPTLQTEARVELLRDYIEERVEEMLRLAQKVAAASDRRLPRNDRLLIRDLEGLLRRLRASKTGKGGGAEPAPLLPPHPKGAPSGLPDGSR